MSPTQSVYYFEFVGPINRHDSLESERPTTKLPFSLIATLLDEPKNTHPVGRTFNMPTLYSPLRKIAVDDLFDGRLAKFGVQEFVGTDADEGPRVLTDGRNRLFVNVCDCCGCVTFELFGANNPKRIFDAITKLFNTGFVSEHELEFWGFDSEEEWYRWQEEEQTQPDEPFPLVYRH
jgi:hypothetical protein